MLTSLDLILRFESALTTVTLCNTDSCRRDPRPADHPRITTTARRRTPRPEPTASSPFQRFRPSTAASTSGFPVDVFHHAGDPDYGNMDDSEEQRIDDDDDDDLDYEASGSRPSRARPGRGRPQTGSSSVTGSSILRDDVLVGRPPKVIPAPPVRTTSGGRGHQRHVVSVTSSSAAASGSGIVRLPVVTSFLACSLAAATMACFHQWKMLNLYY